MRGIEITGIIIDDISWGQWKGPQGPWESYFAWKPVKDIHGKHHWLKKVYRRECNRIVWPPQGYEYGTLFDVLKDAN